MRQGRVETTFFRYKSIIGDGLRTRSPAGQASEVVLGCGSHRQVRSLSVGIVRASHDLCNNATLRRQVLGVDEPVIRATAAGADGMV